MGTLPGTDRLASALVFAEVLHRGQRRKQGPVPYLAHLLSVTGLVLYYGGTEEEAVAAALHDAVEDRGGPQTLTHIRNAFGDGVAAIVEGCSDTDGATIPKPPWRGRKEHWLTRVPGASLSVVLVAAADKLDNARDVIRGLADEGDALWKRFRVGRDEQLWYFRSLVPAFREALARHAGDPRAPRVAALVDDLARVLRQVEEAAG